MFYCSALKRAAINAGPAPGAAHREAGRPRRPEPAAGTPAPGMWRGGFPPRAATPRPPPPAIEFPEENPEPRFDGKRGLRGQPCSLREVWGSREVPPPGAPGSPGLAGWQAG